MNPGLLGLITALCWGTGDFAARFMGRAMGPAQTLMALCAISALALTPLALQGDIETLWDPTTLILTISAGISTAAGALLLYKSLAQGPLGVVVPITSSYPLPLVLIVMVMGELTLSIPLAVAMIATIGGVWIVARSGHKATYSEDHARGTLGHSIWMAATASVVFAFAILITEAAVSRSGTVEVIWLARIVEFVGVAVVVVARGRYAAISIRMAILLVVMALIDALGFLALFTAQGTGDTVIASIASAAYGVVTVILARLVLKEPVKPLQWLGFAIVISGAITLTLLSN